MIRTDGMRTCWVHPCATPRRGSLEVEDVGSKQDENERDNPVAPPVEYAENKWMVSEPSADETPHGDKGTVPVKINQS